MPSRRDITVPNGLTLFRILLAAFAALLFFRREHEAAAAWMCVAASLLDYFDGWYARRFHQKTRLGAHLDPFADKVLISVIFVTAAATIRSNWFSLFVALILFREATLTVFRYVRRKRSGAFTPASMLGRIKTFVQCLVGNGILLHIFVYPAKLPAQNPLLFIIMIMVLVLTLDSGVRYLLPRCSDGKQRSGFERLARWIFGIRAREV